MSWVIRESIWLVLFIYFFQWIETFRNRISVYFINLKINNNNGWCYCEKEKIETRLAVQIIRRSKFNCLVSSIAPIPERNSDFYFYYSTIIFFFYLITTILFAISFYKTQTHVQQIYISNPRYSLKPSTPFPLLFPPFNRIHFTPKKSKFG